MSTVLYSATMSLDGFIAGPGGDMSWMTSYLGPDPVVDELVARVGSIIAGKRTFVGDDPHRDTEHEGEPFGGGWSGPQFVVTHHPPERPVDGITFVGDVAEALELARAAAGEGYVNVLGADIARQCLEMGALDEILTCIVPVLLGDGVRLFARPGGMNVALDRIRISHTDCSTNAWYRVLR